MTPLYYIVSTVGLLLELVILWRSIQARLWRPYPFFCVCMGYFFILAVAQFALAQIQFQAYADAYWLGSTVAVLLTFFIPWEIFRHTFPSRSSIHKLGGQVLLILLIGLAATFLFGARSLGFPYGDLERKADLSQAVLLAATLLLARYYATPLGRNIWGMALGLGLYLSISIMNFAALELFDSFTLFWRWVRPISFIGMLAVWTWALWSYAPNPELAPGHIQRLERMLVGWQHGWKQMRAALRKAVGL